MSESLRFDGAAGTIDACLDAHTREAGAEAVAVLLHPHPLHGGCKEDGVLADLLAPLRAAGADCLRFDFRGVGDSGGVHDQGVGESDDTVAVCAAVRERFPDRPLLLLGYSFGSAVAWRAADRVRPEHLVLVAPPVELMDFSGTRPGVPLDVIVGDRDDFAPLEAVRSWCEARGVCASSIPGADHFFSARRQELAAALAARLAGQDGDRS